MDKKCFATWFKFDNLTINYNENETVLGGKDLRFKAFYLHKTAEVQKFQNLKIDITFCIGFCL
jgi:hypothetical protein